MTISSENRAKSFRRYAGILLLQAGAN